MKNMSRFKVVFIAALNIFMHVPVGSLSCPKAAVFRARNLFVSRAGDVRWVRLKLHQVVQNEVVLDGSLSRVRRVGSAA
jgi:hypothetical protein